MTGLLQLQAQKTDANVFGDVQSAGEHIPFANIRLKGTHIGTTTDETGHYMLTNLPVGKHVIVASLIGYSSEEIEIEAVEGKTIEVNFRLQEKEMHLNEVVVTGTKTFQRKTETPVIVNVLDRKSLIAVQACNLSEGLRFQPGLRVETDCQTCNYTQLRMNGLGGGYSQILINSRPIFSPLIGLYGMEQIPANMIECVEVVRGGGSALYGSSAIGGTVNIITRIPTQAQYSISNTVSSINNGAYDNMFNANVTMVSKKRNAGVLLFANKRNRQPYDHPGLTLLPDGSTKVEKDNYSELPEIRNNSFGGNLIYHPDGHQRIEANFASLYEYRYGGELIGKDKKAHMAMQSEERIHNILMGGIDYQNNFNDNSTLAVYAAGQHTCREHYTGIYPERSSFESDEAYAEAEKQHLADPPYGYTKNMTFQGGVQFNHRIENFFRSVNLISVGCEYVLDDVLDSIPQYNYGTNQISRNLGCFVQSDWKIVKQFSLLLGLRADKHNLVDHVIFSPRVSALYKLKEYTQFRLTWGTGFRAPQAFDADMHIAFAGGGVSRISLAPGLKEERSNSLSGSVNFDKPAEKYIFGFTVEGFYTRLQDAFYLHPVGQDTWGEQFEKRNGPGATVQGATIELRGNYKRKVQLETGFTIQKSLRDQAVENIEGLEAKREFLRSPNHYGYAILTFTPTRKINVALSGNYTGSMLLAKFSPDEEILPNEYRNSPSFFEMNARASYTFEMPSIDSGIELYAGVKNLTNRFQSDFDNYRNRDSNYVYGPALPRTVYIGIKMKSL